MDGMNFTRWKGKMKFLLTTFKVYYVLEGPPIGVLSEEQQMKRDQDETLCRGYILSTLTDRLYDLYTPMTSAKEIWNSLEEKYTAEKEGADKFITFKLFEFSMEDNVSILDQVHEFLILNLNGASSSKVNYVDSGKNNKGNDKKRNGTWNSSKDNKKDKKPLSEVVCYKCGEKGHIKRYCKNPKKKNQNLNKKDESVNAVEQVDTTENTAMVSEMNIGIIQELHMASVITIDDWWYDSDATTHVCNNRDLFKTYKETKDGHEVIMGDNHTSKVIGSGNVEIQFIFGKKLTLMNVLHVPNIRKNLVSGFKLCKKSSNAPRKSERARKERNLDPDFIDSQVIIFLVEGDNENNVINKIPVLLNVEDAAKTYKEAITSRNSAFWKEAIDHEMDSLRQGVDYFDTYAPVARITSIRVLFALALIYNLPIHQMDVKTAFLNGDLDEEVYMKQPEGFVLPGHENKVCKLKKSLYGLKRAPKQWHNKFDKSILSNGFTHNSSDRCIYSKFTKDYGVIICLYVDVILIVETNMKGINETKKFLSSCFQMKDMNEVDTIFGIKVKRHSEGYALNQCHYIDKIIDKFQHLNIEESNTTYESSCKLVENDGRAVAQIEYPSAIGCLMYATHYTRPDIAYDVCKLSGYMSNPSQGHWKAIGRIFGYLKIARQIALYYDRFPVILEGYSDASWITGSSDSKSTTGWIFTLGGGAVCWGSKKQTCITHSTMKAEFLALAVTGKEAEWLRNMLLHIELWPQPMPAISLHCDSQSTLSRAYNKVYNRKFRHISLRHAYIKELISNGIITIEYICSCKNLADPFTKGLPKDIVFGTTKEMGLKFIE
uniref:Zinc finger, CCHC-type n=1 Tax=Tanacetum cinerariifolium TaxID=118510 RepID=A0A6L2M3G8_TANCI|nr:zinc finger, CCHC-type [Tanacetum cinerariifolium]